MARRPRDERYGRELESGAWWAPKRFGYGAGLPIAWQGWAVTLSYIMLIMGAALGILPHSPFAFAAIVVVATAVLVLVIARKTRGGWRWRWGGRG